ncbi:RNA-guided endonuclease InsQ/TnpB family protein [Streptomyces sp. S1A1-3]|uniref:RNA-guided endonuclease InsQ/TnpB family protein n=1 Tax=Streptomyces sp. S1A1-3 TaxID=2594458 RepID=UPI0037D9EBBD
MTAIAQESEGDGHARYTYRLRVSSGARTALEAEWSRCRWLWNECCARSKKAHRDGEKCGPARLDRMLTQARTAMVWLREGSSVPQQQLIRDFAKSRAKALKDIKARLPMRQRASMPRYKKKHQDAPSLNYTRRGFRLKSGRLHLAGGIAVTVVWSRDLPEPPSSVRVYREGTGAWYASFVVPAVTGALPVTGAVIGIDWGVRETATTTSDGHDLPHPQHGKNAAQRLAHYQRMMSSTNAAFVAPIAASAALRAMVDFARNLGWPASTAGPCIWYTPRTPRWTVRSAEREPSTHYLFPKGRIPAPRAES